MTPNASTPPASPDDLSARSRSAQVAFAFLLGAAVALLGVRFIDGRVTRPLDVAPGSPYRIDINAASTGELRQLPGVGAVLANQIVEARPFAHAGEIDRVRGVGRVTAERVRPLINVLGEAAPSTNAKQPPAGPIDPNRASAEELQRLPGIGPVMAQRIVDERQRSRFQKPEDLRRVHGIGVKTLEKIRPFLAF